MLEHMSNYLIVSEERKECEGCGAVIRPGIVAMTDEIHGEGYPVVAQCPPCLKSLDRRLAVAWASLSSFGKLGNLDSLAGTDMASEENLAAMRRKVQG